LAGPGRARPPGQAEGGGAPTDWRLGRWTAKLATAACLRVPAAVVELRAAPDGAPEALVGGCPAPVVVSLSHRAGLAVCMVAPDGVALGCDLELAEPRSAAFVADWFTAGEREAVACAPPGDRALLLAVLWSAEESALKALRAGLRFDTRWVVVDPPALGRDGRWWPLTVRHPAAARVFPGWWRHDAGRVLHDGRRQRAGAPDSAHGRRCTGRALLPTWGGHARRALRSVAIGSEVSYQGNRIGIGGDPKAATTAPPSAGCGRRRRMRAVRTTGRREVERGGVRSEQARASRTGARPYRVAVGGGGDRRCAAGVDRVCPVGRRHDQPGSAPRGQVVAPQRRLPASPLRGRD